MGPLDRRRSGGSARQGLWALLFAFLLLFLSFASAAGSPNPINLSPKRPAAIVYLCDGTPSRVKDLKASLRSLDRFFNAWHRYPVIIFYPRPLTKEEIEKEEQRRKEHPPSTSWGAKIPTASGQGVALTQAQKNELKDSTVAPLSFAEVDFEAMAAAAGPEVVRSIETAPEDVSGFGLGYRWMCFFWSGAVASHPALASYRYYWRLDSDSFLLEPVGGDPFITMAAHSYRYAWATTQCDWQVVTEGLDALAQKHFAPAGSSTAEAEAFADGKLWPAFKDESCDRGFGKDGKTPGPDGKLPGFKTRFNNRIFYNNFEIVDLQWLRGASYQGWVTAVLKEGGIFHHRWGDAPIRTLAVQLALPPEAVWQVTTVSFQHQGLFGPIIMRLVTAAVVVAFLLAAFLAYRCRSSWWCAVLLPGLVLKALRLMTRPITCFGLLRWFDASSRVGILTMAILDHTCCLFLSRANKALAADIAGSSVASQFPGFGGQQPVSALVLAAKTGAVGQRGQRWRNDSGDDGAAGDNDEEGEEADRLLGNGVAAAVGLSRSRSAPSLPSAEGTASDGVGAGALRQPSPSPSSSSSSSSSPRGRAPNNGGSANKRCASLWPFLRFFSGFSFLRWCFGLDLRDAALAPPARTPAAAPGGSIVTRWMSLVLGSLVRPLNWLSCGLASQFAIPSFVVAAHRELFLLPPSSSPSASPSTSFSGLFRKRSGSLGRAGTIAIVTPNPALDDSASAAATPGLSPALPGAADQGADPEGARSAAGDAASAGGLSVRAATIGGSVGLHIRPGSAVRAPFSHLHSQQDLQGTEAAGCDIESPHPHGYATPDGSAVTPVLADGSNAVPLAAWRPLPLFSTDASDSTLEQPSRCFKGDWLDWCWPCVPPRRRTLASRFSTVAASVQLLRGVFLLLVVRLVLLSFSRDRLSSTIYAGASGAGAEEEVSKDFGPSIYSSPSACFPDELECLLKKHADARGRIVVTGATIGMLDFVENLLFSLHNLPSSSPSSSSSSDRDVVPAVWSSGGAKQAGLQGGPVFNHLIFALDKPTADHLIARGIPCYWDSAPVDESALSDGLSDVRDRAKSGTGGTSTALKFGSKAYQAVTMRKNEIMLGVLKAGFNPLYTDADTVWLRNPFSEELYGAEPLWSDERAEERTAAQGKAVKEAAKSGATTSLNEEEKKALEGLERSLYFSSTSSSSGTGTGTSAKPLQFNKELAHPCDGLRLGDTVSGLGEKPAKNDERAAPDAAKAAGCFSPKGAFLPVSSPASEGHGGAGEASSVFYYPWDVKGMYGDTGGLDTGFWYIRSTSRSVAHLQNVIAFQKTQWGLSLPSDQETFNVMLQPWLEHHVTNGSFPNLKTGSEKTIPLREWVKRGKASAAAAKERSFDLVEGDSAIALLPFEAEDVPGSVDSAAGFGPAKMRVAFFDPLEVPNGCRFPESKRRKADLIMVHANCRTGWWDKVSWLTINGMWFVRFWTDSQVDLLTLGILLPWLLLRWLTAMLMVHHCGFSDAAMRRYLERLKK